jgi:hypothetical protein
MKMHLISLNLGIWKIVCIGIEFMDEDNEQLTYEQFQKNSLQCSSHNRPHVILG